MPNENINDNKGSKTIKVRSGELDIPTSEEVRSALETFFSSPETFFSSPDREIEKPIFTPIEPDEDVFEEWEVTRDSADTEIDGTWHQTCVLPDLDDDLVYIPDDPNDIRRILEKFFSTSGMNIILPDRRAVKEPTFVQIESDDEVFDGLEIVDDSVLDLVPDIAAEEAMAILDMEDESDLTDESVVEVPKEDAPINQNDIWDDPIEILSGSDNQDSGDDQFDELVLGNDGSGGEEEILDEDFLLRPAAEGEFDDGETDVHLLDDSENNGLDDGGGGSLLPLDSVEDLEDPAYLNNLPVGDDFLLEPDPCEGLSDSSGIVIGLDSSISDLPMLVEDDFLLTPEPTASDEGLTSSEAMSLLNSSDELILNPNLLKDLPGSSEVVVLDSDVDLVDLIGGEDDECDPIFKDDAFWEKMGEKEEPKKRKWWQRSKKR
ncbi:hypothetical protein HN960_05355 [Candidatus Peregrinibacteria bacterium]|jgi:hypothetical protein|nr:hypothetical protein [Candidatus Peregrinibacteria bacterium]MBT6730915.1 hypothetical protein [Candidatus Peregrinibacteria bacterium]MBT7009829.1 hypothetical protein [Candidatus Peregrinibacteria bacterium]MBT7345422.1 hypothetical protein [Candidatus Peregrinibacteria bacterium]MBT7929022.1 hypothetical protein [Candidatus Peregrinibacteria bacterium]